MSDTVALRHVPRPPGLHRLGGRESRWVDDDGVPVTDPEPLARLTGLHLPPAWTHVWVTTDASAPLQATGIDARGRTQYRYSPDAMARASQDKYAHLQQFARALPTLRQRVDADLRDADTPRVTAVTAAAVRLLDRGLFRVGNDRYARDNHTFGLTTLTTAHVTVTGDEVVFDFVGKEHIGHHVVIRDPQVARVLRARLDDHADPQKWILSAFDPPHVHRVDSATVNAYIHTHAGVGSSAKTFRTWGATVAATALTAGAALPPLDVRRIRDDLRPFHGAAYLLGNTPAVARASYVHPAAVGVGRSAAVRRAVRTAADRSQSTDVRHLLHDEDLHHAVLAGLFRVG